MTKVKRLPGVPQPVRRWGHAACCLNYGDENPKVLISGGVGDNVLGDMWILDVNSGRWTEVRMFNLVVPLWSVLVRAVGRYF